MAESPGSPNTRSFLGSDREKELNAKEIQLREQELELLQLESKMKEIFQEMTQWKDHCTKTLSDINIDGIFIPDIPPSLQQFGTKDKNTISSNSTIPSSPDPETQPDDELLIIIEESTKSRQESKAQAGNTTIQSNNSLIPPPKASGLPNLIEPLTIPPKQSDSEMLSGISTPNIVNKQLLSATKHKKTLSMRKHSEDISSDLLRTKVSESKSDNEDHTEELFRPGSSSTLHLSYEKEESTDMKDYLSTSLGVTRESLFDDTDAEQSDDDVLSKLIEETSIPKLSTSAVRRLKEPAPMSNSVGSVTTRETELPRTNSAASLTTMERKPRNPSEDRNAKSPENHFPADVVNVSRKIRGLEDILQPFRSLKFKFAATVELPQTQSTSSTILHSLRFSRRLARNTQSIDPREPIYVATKCLIILFDDILCICSEKKLEAQLMIVETWMETDTLPQTDDGLYPFNIITPEKSYKCYLDQESKLNALRKIWQVTLRVRLEQEGKYVGNFRRLLAYEFKSGQHYEGEWKAGKFSGKGKQRLPSGEYYEGYFIAGKRNGFGTLILPNKMRYDGYWKFGQRYGKGTLYYPPQDTIATKYVGFWREDLQFGEGRLYLKNGNLLSSIWNDGVPVSPVTLYLEDKKTRYIGDVSDKFFREGFGVCVYSTEDRYYGQWAGDDRQGKGFYVTPKGTEYHGSWANNQMEGNGTLCFGNDESIVTGKFCGDMASGSVKVDGEFKLGRYDSQTKLSTLQGYKWHCFFSMRLSQQARGSNTEQVQALNEALLDSVNGKSTNTVKQSLMHIFQSSYHPLGKLVSEFVNIFSSLYNKPEQYFMQLPCAVDDLQAFLNLLSNSFVSQFLKCQVTHEDCSEALHEAVFEDISSTLLAMYNITHEEKDNACDIKIKEILTLPLRQQFAVCGIDEKFWNPIQEIIENDFRLKAVDLAPSADKAPFQNALNAMRSMAVQKTVTKKLESVKDAATRVESLLKRLMDQFGADEFLPMFCFIMVCSEVPKLHSECCFMEDFMDDNLRFNVFGYMLAQMQIATGFLISCNIRDKLEEGNFISKPPPVENPSELTDTTAVSGPL